METWSSDERSHSDHDKDPNTHVLRRTNVNEATLLQKVRNETKLR